MTKMSILAAERLNKLEKKRRHRAREANKPPTATQQGRASLSEDVQNEHPGRRGVENIEKSNATEHEKLKKKRAPRSMGVPVCQPISKMSIMAVEGLKKSELATTPSMRSTKKSERHRAWEHYFSFFEHPPRDTHAPF